MKMKITEKIICLPPYLSTTWDKIASMQSEKEGETNRFTLIFHLTDGNIVRLYSMDASIVEIAFSFHAQYLESLNTKPEESISKANPLLAFLNLSPEQLNSIPFRLNFGSMMPGSEGIENTFQHNPSQSQSPTLPSEMLEKIAKIALTMTNGDLTQFPKAEPHCNCFHCQVLRAICGEKKEEESEEIVSDEELQFHNWDISQTGDQLYLVKNPLDSKEQYSVYLGTPIGCTCGNSDCEHIRAVLYS